MYWNVIKARYIWNVPRLTLTWDVLKYKYLSNNELIYTD